MSTAVTEAKKPGTQLTIREYLNSDAIHREIARVLPSHLTPDRMIRVALTALTKTPKLAQCTQASFFECLLNCSQWGLEPDGRRAHLIPYGDKCTLIVDYKGIAELCYRSGSVNAIHADVVRRGDLFEYSCGYVTKPTTMFRRVHARRSARIAAMDSQTLGVSSTQATLDFDAPVARARSTPRTCNVCGTRQTIWFPV